MDREGSFHYPSPSLHGPPLSLLEHRPFWQVERLVKVAGAERYVLHERTRGCVDGQGLPGMQAGEGKCACDVRSNQDSWSGQVTSDDPGLWIG